MFQQTAGAAELPGHAIGNLFTRLEARIRDQFDLTLLPKAAFKPHEYAEGGSTFWGNEQLELESAWAHVPAIGHRSFHINGWVAASQLVPHLSIIVATTPAPFLFLDLLPRVDMVEEVDYLDRYYGPLDTLFREVRGDSTLRPFTMGSPYLRQAVSPSALCFTADATPKAVARIEQLAETILEDWITLVREGDPVPEAARSALAARDLKLRETIARRDPGPTGRGGCSASVAPPSAN